jgi:hypothetical protein
MESTSEAPVPGIIESMDAAADERILYDRKEAARQLSISVRSLDYIIAAKGLDTRRIGRKVLVTRASLVRYASGNHFALTSRSDADTEDFGERCE